MAASGSIGYIGIGLMGTPMVLRLVDAGYGLHVWGRSPQKLRPVLEAGATAMASAAEVARACDLTFLCVSDTDAVESVVFGDNGVAAGGAAGKLLVDMSSIRPDATRRMAERLRTDTGMAWLDAPVSGGVVGAENGTLAVMAGGEAEDFRRAEPVVAHLSQRFTLMGPCGAGQTTKLVNQLIVGCSLAVISEATQFAAAAGVDARRIPEALAGGRADSPVLQQWMPKMAAGDYALESYLRTMLKDLDTLLAAARETRTALPLASLTAELHRLMAAKGFADADGTSLHRLYDPVQMESDG